MENIDEKIKKINETLEQIEDIEEMRRKLKDVRTNKSEPIQHKWCCFVSDEVNDKLENAQKTFNLSRDELLRNIIDDWLGDKT